MEVTAAPAGAELRRRARDAGLLYLLVVFTAPWVILVLPRMLEVPSDAAATAARIREHEWLARAAVAAGVAESVLWIAVVLAVHRFLRLVDRDLARTLLVFGTLVPTPLGLAADGLRLAAHTLAVGAPFLAPIPVPQQEALAYLALRVNDQLANVVSVFWGLWLFPFAWLLARPGLAPRWIGVALAVTGVGYVVDAFLTMLAPGLAESAAPAFFVTAFGELPAIGWLVWWGTRRAALRHDAAGTVR